jgi:predicted DNA-binding transcriptional regulator AlpA
MSERNAALAEAIAGGLEHIVKGLREWAQAQRAQSDRPASRVPPAADGGDRLVKIKGAAQILGVSTSTVYKLMNDGTLKKHEHTGHIARSELDRFIQQSSTR